MNSNNISGDININQQIIPVDQNPQLNQINNNNQQHNDIRSQIQIIDNENNQCQNMPKKEQLVSNNFQYQCTLQQIYMLEQECLKKCNEWFQDKKVTYKITNEQVRFSTMLELEVFVMQARNRIKQTRYNCFKYGSIFGITLSTLFFYLSSQKAFTGGNIYRINGLSALCGGIFSFILSKQDDISNVLCNLDVNIDFAAFDQFFESNLQDIYKLRNKLVI